jgi:hypothetical protein
MKRLKFVTLLAVLFLINCTSEPDEQTYTSRFRNNSNSAIMITGFNFPSDLVFDETVSVDGLSTNCVISSEAFLGISCSIDSLVIRFENDKGYICAKIGANSVGNPNQFCFLNKSPFDSLSFQDLGNNTFEFEITQEDFDNAFDLP